MDLTSSVSGTTAFLLLVFGFGFIIFVHELGHFLVAKAVGIKVTQFAIGFGHALVAWRKGLGYRVGTTEPTFQKRIREHLLAKGVIAGPEEKISEEQANRAADELGLGETEYRLNWMPLGGYVKMLGQEDLDPTAVSSDPRAYNNKPVWARVCVVSAGVIMNTIFAVIFFIAAFLWGVEFPPAVVGNVLPGSPAATTPASNNPDVIGLKTGDEFVLINGEEPTDFMSVQVASALAAGGEPVDLVVSRPTGEGEHERLTFSIAPVRSEQQEGLRMLGISPTLSLNLPEATGPDVPYAQELKKIGLRPGMRIVAVNGQPISEYWQLYRAVQASKGQPLSLTFEDKAGQVTREVGVQTALAEAQTPQSIDHVAGLVLPTKIAAVMPDGAAAGVLKEGDLIAAAGDKTWPAVTELIEAVETSEGDLELAVIRDGKRETVSVTPSQSWRAPRRIGVAPIPAVESNIIGRVLPESPFAEFAWRPGTRIEKIGDRAITSYNDIRLALQAAGTEPVEITVSLPVEGGVTETVTAKLTPAALASLRELEWGLAATQIMLEPLLVKQQAKNPMDAVVIGFRKTKLFMVQTYQTLGALFRGDVRVSNLRGPVGIVSAGTAMTKRGVPYLMFFLGLISINLAVINFLPLPIVDGGLFVLLMIEKLRGKPVSPQIQSAITIAGLVLLGTIFLMVTYHDIAREFGG